MPAVNGVGEPCAREPHARFEVAGAGNGAARSAFCESRVGVLKDATTTARSGLSRSISSNRASARPYDFPGLDLGEYREVLGGLHHIAISVTAEQWDRLVGKLEAAGVETFIVNGSSVYFSGPDGERLELLSYPLNDMYGTVVN